MARVAGEDRLVVWVTSEDALRPGDPDVVVGTQADLGEHAVDALTALASDGIYGFDLRALRSLGRENEITAVGFAVGGGPSVARRLLFDALDRLGRSLERIREAPGLLVVMWGPRHARMQTFEEMVGPLAELIGGDAFLLFQACVRPIDDFKLVALGWERGPGASPLRSPREASPE